MIFYSFFGNNDESNDKQWTMMYDTLSFCWDAIIYRAYEHHLK